MFEGLIFNLPHITMLSVKTKWIVDLNNVIFMARDSHKNAKYQVFRTKTDTQFFGRETWYSTKYQVYRLESAVFAKNIRYFARKSQFRVLCLWNIYENFIREKWYRLGIKITTVDFKIKRSTAWTPRNTWCYTIAPERSPTLIWILTPVRKFLSAIKKN